MASRGKKQHRAARRAEPAAAPAPAVAQIAAPQGAVPSGAAPPDVAELLSLAPRPAGLSAPKPARRASRRRAADAVIGLLLAAAVFLVFGQCASHEFVNFDDDEYVYENRDVRAGITLQGVRFAFTRLQSVNWHPLTTLSHMLDCQLFNLWAGGHHLTNVLLHALTAIFLYVVLRQMTGRVACSALAAFLFAVHPLRVESVAWVAERKDVLSGLFFTFTLIAYASYVRKPNSLLRTLALPAVYALGLMCKPMLVTTPLVLLLLDYWPLRRWPARGQKSDADETLPSSARPASFRALLVEKTPLFILSVCSCAITLVAQSGAMPNVEQVTLWRRAVNCLIAYASYLRLSVWPAGLAIYYPYSFAAPNPWAVAGSIALLAGISLVAWKLRRARPYLIVGWLWYLGMLVPVIGLVQVGYQALADRYTYLPMIGPVVALVWFVADAAGRSVYRRFAFSLAGIAAVLAFAVCAARQATFWRNDITLWNRALACTSGNYVAHLHLGNALFKNQQYRDAAQQYEAALHDYPDFCEAHFDLGAALDALGQPDAALRQYDTVLKLRPAHFKARVNLGTILLDRENYAAAADQFRQALAINPSYALAHNNLGIAQMAFGQYAAAAESFRTAARLDPDYLDPHANLGHALGRLGQSAEAASELRGFLQKQPDNALVEGWLAWILATARDDSVRDGRAALDLAMKAAAATQNYDPSILDALAAAQAETGRFAAAIKTAARAATLARASHQNDLAAEIEQRVALYRRGQPVRQ